METEIKTCMVEVEAMDLEANPEEMKSITVYEEVLKEEATVKTVRALKKWCGDRQLAESCHQKLRKRTQGNSGSLKKLATTCREMTHHDIPVWHKGHCCQGQGCAKNPERTDVQEETLDETRRRQRNKGLRL
jgi:hypothetical protein